VPPWTTPWPPAENPANANMPIIDEDNESDEEDQMDMFQHSDDRYRPPFQVQLSYGRNEPDPPTYYSPHLSQVAEQLRNRYMVPTMPTGNEFYNFSLPENLYSEPPLYQDRDQPFPHITKSSSSPNFLSMSHKERLELLKCSVPEEGNKLQYLPFPSLSSINPYPKSQSEPMLYSRPFPPTFDLQESDEHSALDSSDDSDVNHQRPISSSEDEDGNMKSHRQKLSRKQFRETIGTDLYTDLDSGKFSYEEVIDKYKRTYPEYAHKFTRNFCSKVRCGRILVNSTGAKQRCVKNGDPRMKRIPKISNRRTWTKMTQKLFSEIYDWELNQTQPVKQQDIESTFNVNRSTYYRWKRRFEATREN